jgi:hypothetical protein
VHIVFGGSPTATANDIFLHIFTCWPTWNF